MTLMHRANIINALRAAVGACPDGVCARLASPCDFWEFSYLLTSTFLAPGLNSPLGTPRWLAPDPKDHAAWEELAAAVLAVRRIKNVSGSGGSYTGTDRGQ